MHSHRSGLHLAHIEGTVLNCIKTPSLTTATTAVVLEQVVQALTSIDDSEIIECLRFLRDSTGSSGSPTYFMHEAVDDDDGSTYTRPWYATHPHAKSSLTAIHTQVRDGKLPFRRAGAPHFGNTAWTDQRYFHSSSNTGATTQPISLAGVLYTTVSRWLQRRRWWQGLLSRHTWIWRWLLVGAGLRLFVLVTSQKPVTGTSECQCECQCE
jgi:hypothetical protein